MFGQPSIQIKQEANVVHSRRFAPSSSRSEKIQKRKEGKGKGPTIAVKGKGKAKVVIKEKCFHCNVDEHWKKNCPKYLVKKKEKEETSSFKQLEESEMTLKVGTGDIISARAVGDAKLGHTNLDRIGRLVKNGLLNKLEDDSLPPCESCLEGKMTKRPFTGKGYRAKEPLELIHSDLYGPMNVNARGGFKYFISFIDDIQERRNRTLLDMVHSMMSYAQLPSSFLGYVVETTVHILNNVPSKSVSETPFELWRGQTKGGLFFDPQENRVFVSTNATFLEEDHMRDHKPRSKLVLNEATYDSTRVVDEVGPSSRVDETTTSGQSHHSQSLRMPRRRGRIAMNDVDKDQWVKAMDLEMESMYFNSVWELVDLPEWVKPIGCKWIYKRKRDSAGKVQTFKARLVAKGYTQREWVDYEETFSLVAMFKSIRIILSIATFYDYEIWQMDFKTAFLNGSLEESIFMSQPEGSWNIKFDTAIKSYGFDQNVDEPCVYKKINKGKAPFLVLYVDDILLIGNDVGYLTNVKAWLAAQFQMKDLGEAQYVLGIQIIRDRKNKMLALSQATYIDKILVRYSMQNSKKGLLPFRHGVHLSKKQCPKKPQEIEDMRRIPYTSAVGSLIYATLYNRPNICYTV
ncbi:gag/pol protein [Cucumis melo var. makuwa]|uniref:Gag/pol protein n=1 Tax=Cucumis melo var. makuwa TaxID=1194695 RepID=A0A5A7US54_CUCMM|nr:gag/pol protein [Cucumis melo var. makuwa]